MRSLDDVFADLESDRSQRESEIRLLENILSAASSEIEQNMLRRSIIVLTYAHFEGFCKFSLLAYASAVNAKGLACKDAAIPLVALTLARVFAALRDKNYKHPYFSNELPDDSQLHLAARERVHLAARERAFLEHLSTISDQTVEIPDAVIDTRSNLNAIILKRNLYQLGLDYPPVDKHASVINKMLGVRNAISHGDRLKVPKPEELKQYMVSAFEIMRFVQNEIYDVYKDGIPLTVPRFGRAFRRL